MPAADDRIALVTGGSRGIGRAVAQRLASRGVRIALHFSSRRKDAEEALSSLSGTGHHLVQADLSVAGGAARAWAQTIEALGAIDILVNNAGMYELHPPLQTSPETWSEVWEKTLRLNLTSPAELAHAAGLAMAERKRGRIIAISSRGAFRGEPSAPAYGASKAGLNALHQSLAKALAPAQIGVYVVAPGWVATDMAAEHLQGPRSREILSDQPLGRVAEPDEVARVVEFCALDAPLSMTGAIIDVNGSSYLRT